MYEDIPFFFTQKVSVGLEILVRNFLVVSVLCAKFSKGSRLCDKMWRAVDMFEPSEVRGFSRHLGGRGKGRGKEGRKENG